MQLSQKQFRCAYRSIVVFLFVLFSAAGTLAAELSGRVVGVSDGDTITVLSASHSRWKIRLTGIDAPEKKQAFGQRAKQRLSDLVFGRQVRVEWRKRDRYGRTLGKVRLRGEDVNLRMLAEGYAWHYRQYLRDQPPADRARYAVAESAARAARRGLWRDPRPVPPWAYRHTRRRH